MYYMPRLGSLVGPTRLHLIHTNILNFFLGGGNGALFNKIFDVIVQHHSHYVAWLTTINFYNLEILSVCLKLECE
jgi:hypothetical protein